VSARKTAQVPREERANLWATCAAQFLTLAGMTAVLPLLPLYLQQIGVVERDALRYWTGVLGAAPFAVAVFATPLWGALADRFGHKPMVVRSVAGISIATVGMGLSSTPVSLLGWRGLQGAVSGVFPAAVALLSAHTPEVRMSRALAILQSARAAGALCGPLIGGVLADLVEDREASWENLLYLHDPVAPLPPEPFRFLGFQGGYLGMRFMDFLDRFS